MYKSILALSLSIAWTGFQVHAQQIPEHLAAMTAQIFTSYSADFEAADPESETGWPLMKAHDALKEMGVSNWSVKGFPSFNPSSELKAHLHVEARETNDFFPKFLKDVSEYGTEQALTNHLKAEGFSVVKGEDFFNLSQDVSRLIDESWGAPEREVELTSAAGRNVKMLWEPAFNQFRIEVYDPADGPRAESLVVLPGDLTLEKDAEDALGLKLASTKPTVFDAEMLAQGRAAIFGEWIDRTSGDTWIITPLGTTTGAEDDLPVPQNAVANSNARERIQDIDAEIDDLTSGETIYHWQNTETGEEDRQKRFKRLQDPWNYIGEQSETEGADERVAALIEERGTLLASLDPVADFQRPPDLPEIGAQGVIGLTMLITENGHTDYIDQARFDGTEISGRDAMFHVEDYAPLPSEVIHQLINNYLPERWFELRPQLDTTTGEWTLKGKYWGQHVTYSGETLRVKSIHTPFSTPIDLRKKAKKAP